MNAQCGHSKLILVDNVLTCGTCDLSMSGYELSELQIFEVCLRADMRLAREAAGHSEFSSEPLEGVIKRLTDECAVWKDQCERARRTAAAAEREADRLRHNVPVDGDFVCPDSLALTEARAEIERLQKRLRKIEEAVSGVEVSPFMPGSDDCEACGGSGDDHLFSDNPVCPDCKGSGKKP
jgi:hypothetical protein